MNSDPIDNPHGDDLGAQKQDPNVPVAKAQIKAIPAP